MRRNKLVYLEEMMLAAEDIFSFAAGKTVDDYLNESMLRAAIERKFILIGEIIAQMRQFYPDVMQRISHAREIVDFRNLITHHISS